MKSNIKNKQNSEIRKDFYKRLLYIVICIIVVLVFAKATYMYSLIPMFFFLFGIYQLIQLIRRSQNIIDDFFPPKTKNEIKAKPFDKFIYYFSLTLFFTGLIGLISEITNFDNTIDGIKLFWISGSIGVLLACIITFILKLTKSSVYNESKRRYTVHLGLFAGLFLLSAAITGFINHSLADDTPIYKKYKIAQKSNGSSRSKSYFFFINTKVNTEERLTVDKSFYDQCKEGEEIELHMVKGYWGFDYIISLSKPQK